MKLPEVYHQALLSIPVWLLLPSLPPCLPQVLCIHLKRFRFDAYFSSKISRHIAFPMHDLDMGSYVKDSESVGTIVLGTLEWCVLSVY